MSNDYRAAKMLELTFGACTQGVLEWQGSQRVPKGIELLVHVSSSVVSAALLIFVFTSLIRDALQHLSQGSRPYLPQGFQEMVV